MTQQTAQIVSFTFPKKHWNDCDDAREAIFQLKLKAINMLNRVAAGRYIMSEGNVSAMHEVNDLCALVGLSPLDF